MSLVDDKICQHQFVSVNFGYINLKLFGWASTLKLLTWLVKDYEMLFKPVVLYSVTHSLCQHHFLGG